MRMMCRKGSAGKWLYGRVAAFIMTMLLVVTALPAADAIPAYAAGMEKIPVQLRIGGRKVTKKTYRMEQGSEKKLKVVAETKKTVQFHSSNKRVASISKTGVIQSKKTGTAKITAVVKTSQGRKNVWMKVKVVPSGKDKKTDTAKSPDTTAVPPETDKPDETAAPTPAGQPDVAATPTDTPTDTPGAVTPVPPVIPDENEEKILIVYFTRSGNTEVLADMIQDKTGGTKFRIETVKEYPEDYSGVYDEAMKEQQENVRPELKSSVENMADYDTVFVGYPIWHGDTPMAIRSFLEGYDFTGKKVVPFCSSGSSRPEPSFASISASAHGAEVLDGFWTQEAYVENAADEINQWIGRLQIMKENEEEETMKDQISITAGSHVFIAALADNSSAEALKELLRQGTLTINMSDYASMEKVGPIGTSLPRNDERIVTEAGDMILYQGNSLVIYYDTNTWNFTRIGKIEGVTKDQLLAAMGNGNVTVTIELLQ